jgi:RecA-family ATPase
VCFHWQRLVSHGRHRGETSLDARLIIVDAAAALRFVEQDSFKIAACQLAQPLPEPGYVRNLLRSFSNDANDVIRFVAQLDLLVRHFLPQGFKA